MIEQLGTTGVGLGAFRHPVGTAAGCPAAVPTDST
jgi:hypothetical protein